MYQGANGFERIPRSVGACARGVPVKWELARTCCIVRNHLPLKGLQLIEAPSWLCCKPATVARARSWYEELVSE
jgi:hypothetical protein